MFSDLKCKVCGVVNVNDGECGVCLIEKKRAAKTRAILAMEKLDDLGNSACIFELLEHQKTIREALRLMADNNDDQIDRLCQFALDNGFSTGHADTMEQAIDEILPQIKSALDKHAAVIKEIENKDCNIHARFHPGCEECNKR